MSMFFGIIAILAVIFIAIKLGEDRMPDWAVKASVLYYVLVPLAGLLFAIGYMWNGDWVGWREIALFALFCLLAGVGTGVGYHRLLSHISFETSSWLRFLFIALGAMALPTRPIDFAANHRKHHAFSDKEGDPHSPLDGFWHAHFLHIFDRNTADREKYCKRHLADPLVMFIDRTYLVWFGLGLLLPALIGYMIGIGALQGLLWGGLIRIFYHNHVTFAVNSVCHTFGDQPFDIPDESRNNWLIGLLAFGEGWHHNHHAFPAMAVHGMGWRQFDLNGLIILGLKRLNLAWDVKEPSVELIKRRRKSKSAVVPVN